MPQKTPARERIFDAALRLLRQGGTEAATQRAVCIEARIKAPTLYYYFGDMHGLYREVVGYVVDRMRGAGVSSDLSPRERIEDTWTSHVRMAQEEPGLFDLWNRHLAWDKLSSTSLLSYQRLQLAFAQAGKEHKLTLDPKTAAYVFWAAAHGMACLIAASHHDGVPYPKGAADALKQGVLARIFERPL
jgi:AcrR family transcriptional regulator